MGLKMGYKLFVLCGSDIGAYGKDIRTDLITLLRRIMEREGDYKIALTSFNLRWWRDMGSDIIELFKSGKIEYFSVPVQSGSNRILKLMKRDYTAEDFENCIKSLKSVNPEVTIYTDVMCGFPGETEEDFKKTLRLLENPRITCALPTVYSERPKTETFPSEMKVPNYVKKSREIRLYVKFFFNRLKRNVLR
jgi:tRNA A37 methylthiotransferase MiaB